MCCAHIRVKGCTRKMTQNYRSHFICQKITKKNYTLKTTCKPPPYPLPLPLPLHPVCTGIHRGGGNSYSYLQYPLH